MKRLCLLLCMLLCLAPLGAQTNKRIKDLQNRQGQLRKQIEETQTLLNSTKKDVGSQLNTLNALTGQIDERRRYIDTLTSDMAQIDAEMNVVEAQLSRLQTDLLAQKDDYVASLRYLQRHGSIQQKLMFISLQARWRRPCAAYATCVSMPPIRKLKDWSCSNNSKTSAPNAKNWRR